MKRRGCLTCDYALIIRAGNMNTAGFKLADKCTLFKTAKYHYSSGKIYKYKQCYEINHNCNCKHWIKRRPFWKRLFGINKPKDGLDIQKVNHEDS